MSPLPEPSGSRDTAGDRPEADRWSTGRVPSGDSALLRAGRAVQRLVTSAGPSRELVDLAAAVQMPVTTGRRIAVVSVRGGVGRSTVTALLGSVYCARRADHVLVADADPEPGSLAWRLGLAGTGTGSLGVLAPRLLAACSGGFDGVDALLARTPAGLRLLPGASPGQQRSPREVLRALSRFFAVAVADCGRGLEQPTTLDVVAECHAVVVVAPATPDGLRSTCAGLDRLPAGAMSRTSVALCTLDRSGHAAIASTARAVLERFDVPVVWLPHDRHLAAGAPIVPGRVGEAVTVAATRLAGHALDRANRA